GLVQMLCERRPQRGHHPWPLLVEVHEAPPHVRFGEAAPQDVAVLAGHRVPLVEEVLLRPVAGEEVVAGIEQHRGHRLQRVEDLAQHRRDRHHRRLGGHDRHVGEPVQVLDLGLVQPQRAGDRVQDLHAGADRPALLEPGVPGHPDAGELRNLLAAQPRGAPAQARRQAHAGGAGAGAAGPQERGQLRAPAAAGCAVAVAAGGRRSHGRLVDGRHVLSVQRRSRWCQVLPIPGSLGSWYPFGGRRTLRGMTTATTTVPTGADSTERRRWLMLAVLITGQFMAVLDVTNVNGAIPTIREKLDASGAALQLVVAGYTVTYAMLLITGARLGDRRGPPPSFPAGTGTFPLASLACGLAPTTGALITARSVQGAGAALMVPQILSLIQRQFAGG